MEADWSVEVGADFPVIFVPWEGYIDLRRGPSVVSEIAEAAEIPELAQALIKLNLKTSPVFSSKCDLWLLPEDEIDPLEFETSRKDAKQGIACYIDIVARAQASFSSFPACERWARSATHEMHSVRMPQARVELVVRPAVVDAREGFAITLYVAACAATESGARGVFRAALETAVTITMEQATTVGE